MYVPSKYIVYLDTFSSHIIFTKEVIKQLFKYRQKDKFMTEAGGYLIGRHLLQTNDRVIDQISTPTCIDKRFHSKFYRSNIHNYILFNKWLISEKTQTLIGLWHTHPEASPSPSYIDKQDWLNAINSGDFIGKSLLFLIVGQEETRIWEGFRSGYFNEIYIER